MNQELWWYTVRASGLVAWGLLAASVLWGLVLSIRRTTARGERPKPAWLLDLHRFLGPLAFVFVGVHLVGLLFDRWVGFGPVDLLVVYATDWRPGAVAWGIVALYLMIAVQVTSLLMGRISRRLWHTIHLLGFVVYIAATIHLFAAGADGGNRVVQATAVAMSTTLGVLVLVRLAMMRAPARRLHLPPSLDAPRRVLPLSDAAVSGPE